MIQNNLQFKGAMTEDPNQNLKQFLQLCDTFKFNGVSNDAIRTRIYRDLERTCEEVSTQVLSYQQNGPTKEGGRYIQAIRRKRFSQSFGTFKDVDPMISTSWYT
ncbi:oligopeptide transporter 4-like [Gossypium australe]|uniref:Oligopeptide transporter 4-like n=1 Tax=Gossypium australe TaxID=47621 RepID=A0A5B6UXV1_9ROSI|nr:oligopeptide transporter 4-like [Gossypium australe]